MTEQPASTQRASSSGSSQHPPIIRRLSNALRAPFRRNSATSNSVESEPPVVNSATVPEQAISTSPPTTQQTLPPIESQENLPTESGSHPSHGSHPHPLPGSAAKSEDHKPTFLQRIWSHHDNNHEKQPSSDSSQDLLPTSPAHHQHPCDVHAGKQRYTFTPEQVEPAPYDVLGTADVDAQQAAHSPSNVAVRRQSTQQPDPLFKTEANDQRTQPSSRPGLTSLDSGDYVQDHVLEGMARLGHPFHKSVREPWQASPEALKKEHELHQQNHLQQAIQSELQDEQSKAHLVAQQEQQRSQHDQTQSAHDHSFQWQPKSNQAQWHETSPISRSKTTDPNSFSNRKQPEGAPVDAGTNQVSGSTSGHRRASSGSPTSPTSPTSSTSKNQTSGQSPSSPKNSSPQGPQRHPGIIHLLDSGDYVQDKVLGALSFAGGRRRSSAASSGGGSNKPQSPMTSPGVKPNQPVQQVPQVPPLPESLGERTEKFTTTN